MQEREKSDRGILLLSGCFAYQINDASMKFESVLNYGIQVVLKLATKPSI